MKITTNFFTHHKTRKLQKLLGDSAVLSLLKLWSYAETTRSDGVFTNMSEQDIELACDTCGEHEGIFVTTLVEIGFLDERDGVFVLHDWEPHPQPLSMNGEGSEENLPETLGDAGRVGILKRWNPEAYKQLQIMGIRTLSKAGYEAWRNWSKEKPKPRSEYQEERRIDKAMAEVEALGIANDPERERFEYRKRGYELEAVNLDAAA